MKIDKASTNLCPVDVTLRIIGGRWKSLILWNIREKTLRYSELKKSMPGITQRVLTHQLRELEKDGVVVRTVFPEVPVRVEYALTSLGKSLRPILDALCAWGQKRRKAQKKADFAQNGGVIKSSNAG